ncbi:MAG: phosphoesterase [Chlamydiae bacterium]|nr:MAG: phosphoesterase [Chlamydiota bacterium]
MIDLHTHSSFSDGTFTPTQLVEEAVKRSVDVISLTDHDSIDGNHEFLLSAENHNIKAIAGLEISAEYTVPSNGNVNGAMHILGYFPFWDERTEKALSNLEEIRDNRNIRNPKIIDLLQEKGFDITLEEVAEFADNNVVGRPHIAAVMMKKNYVRNMKQAFDDYLAKGRLAYVSRTLPTPENAIKMILEAGGVPVLAHPVSLRINSEDVFRNVLEELVNYGLQGIEVITASSRWDETQSYLGYAYLYDLVATVGSDFHGNNKPSISLGIKYDRKEKAEEDCIEQIIHRARYRSCLKIN